MESASHTSPQTKPKLFCFVLMPFSSDFDDVYQIGIKEACQAAGAYCERVDEQHYNERMLERIYNQIAKADLLIADMTGKNANVFYEVGYAHALGKPTVLLTRNAADIPFDLTQFPHIVYESKLTFLREKLTARVAWHIANPGTKLEDTAFALTLLINGNNPLEEQIFVQAKGDNHWIDLNLTIGNQSSTYLDDGDYKIGLIDDGLIESVTIYGKAYNRAFLGDGRSQFVIPAQKGLMPAEFGSLPLTLVINTASEFLDSYVFTLRLFTKKSLRDFEVKYISNSTPLPNKS
jgi:nucleoside 2-deoxyribosyltransferase